jgi:hypothetical protein
MSKYINTLIQLVELPNTNSEIANNCRLLTEAFGNRSRNLCAYTTHVGCNQCLFDFGFQYESNINGVTDVPKKSN